MSPRIAVAPGVARRVAPGLVRALARRLRRAAQRLGVSQSGLEGLGVRIVGDAEMSVLHRRHLGLEGPTDVLSFPAEDDDGFGDLVLDWDAIERQAADPSGAARLAEAASLAVHGLVHLLGHDHGTRPEARAMLRLERRASRAAGLPPVRRPYGGGR